MPSLGLDLSNSRLIMANVDEREYHFIIREHPILGKIISLLENGKEYGLIDKQIANKDKFIKSELIKLDYFNIDVLIIHLDGYGSAWINLVYMLVRLLITK